MPLLTSPADRYPTTSTNMYLPLLLLLIFGAETLGAKESPVGLWRTIDDRDHAEKSLVRIRQQGGSLNGQVERVLDPSVKPGAVCAKCKDSRKDQPLVGLPILRDLKPSGEEPGYWDGGDILDPKDGQIYSVRVKPLEQGRKLEVRGYLGARWLGRTQVWERVE